jgi:hypothetical protein
MPNKRSRLLLTVLGGSAMYDSISDAFTADSGRWLDGALLPAALTIDTARAVWAPTEESEINTTAGANSDPNGNEANGTGSWGGVGITLSVESSDVNTGSYALKLVSADGTADRAYIDRTTASRKWRVIRAAAKAVSGSAWTLRTSAGGTVSPLVPVAAGWANYVYTDKKSADYTGDSMWCDAGAAADTALLDNYSVKELTPASQFRIQRIYYPSSVAVKAWMSGYTPLGVVVYKDADNWVLALAQRSGVIFSAALWKSVAGTVTVVNAGVTTTYSAGALLELIPAADFQTWTVKYNTATRVNAASITDFAATGTWYAGLFNTHNPSNITAVSFDDFAAAKLTGASPFESAPAEAGATVALEATTVVRESLTEPDWFGRASVKTLSTGVTVMTYYRGTGHAENQGAIHICFSNDYGETWTAEDADLNDDAVAGFPMLPPVLDTGEDADESWLVKYDDDTLLLFIQRENWPSTFKGTYQSKSVDGGITWTTPAYVTVTGSQDSDYARLTNDHAIYNGRLYCAYEDKYGGGERCCLAYTDDVGANWTHLSVIATNTSEAALEYVGNDTLVSVLRSRTNNQTITNRSTNLGTSWVGATELTWRIPPICRPRIKTRAHLKGEANWWEDTHLILWGGYFENSKRINCVSFSKDSGATWTIPTALDTPYDDAAYGDILYNPNADTYEYLCYRGNGFAGPARIVQYSLRVDWGT